MPLILAPPGSGKTHWVQSHPVWHDMDVLYSRLHTKEWHDRPHTTAEEREHYGAIDAAVERDRSTLHIIGSLFWDITPDAIVLVPIDVHRTRVNARDDLTWIQAEGVALYMRQLAIECDVPIFDSFDAAAAAVTK